MSELKWKKVRGGFWMGGSAGEPHAFIKRATLETGGTIWVWFAYCDQGDGKKPSAEGWSYTAGYDDGGAKSIAGEWLRKRLAGVT